MKNFDFIDYRIEGWDPLYDKIHVHNDSYEILQIISGSGHFVIGGTPYPIVPGAVYFTNTIQLHCSRPDDTAEYVRSKITVNATYFDDVLRVLGLADLSRSVFGINGGCYVELSPDTVTAVDKNFKEMSKLKDSSASDANARITMLLVQVLLASVRERPTTEILGDKDNTLISRTINYINKNISTDISIEQIAKEIFVSKYHLCRTFKTTIGVSIMKYILSQRITLAKEQLINTDASCSDIAMTMGFSSFSYFCRAFKEHEGITPNQYRQTYGKFKKSNK